jgi:hypothetical protein
MVEWPEKGWSESGVLPITPRRNFRRRESNPDCRLLKRSNAPARRPPTYVIRKTPENWQRGTACPVLDVKYLATSTASVRHDDDDGKNPYRGVSVGRVPTPGHGQFRFRIGSMDRYSIRPPRKKSAFRQTMDTRGVEPRLLPREGSVFPLDQRPDGDNTPITVKRQSLSAVRLSGPDTLEGDWQ